MGEGTRTDVAQTEAQRSSAIAQLSAARAQALASAATYRQIVGDDPGKLKAAPPLTKLLPRNIDSAFTLAANEHPAILATEHAVDAAAFNVKSAEGALLPQLSASAGVSRDYRNTDLPGVGSGSSSDGYSNSASVGATLTIPIYTGGRADAQVLDLIARDEVTAGVSVDDGFQGIEQGSFGNGHGGSGRRQWKTWRASLAPATAGAQGTAGRARGIRCPAGPSGSPPGRRLK